MPYNNEEVCIKLCVEDQELRFQGPRQAQFLLNSPYFCVRRLLRPAESVVACGGLLAPKAACYSIKRYSQTGETESESAGNCATRYECLLSAPEHKIEKDSVLRPVTEALTAKKPASSPRGPQRQVIPISAHNKRTTVQNLSGSGRV